MLQRIITSVLLSVVFATTACGQVPDPRELQAGELFRHVEPKLSEALELYDRHRTLPDSAWFRADKQSNLSEINRLLDQAVAALNVSQVTDIRQRIRKHEAAIRQSHNDIAEYRNQRIGAPDKEAVGLLGKFNPFSQTRQEYDELIAAEQQKIKLHNEAIDALKADFALKLRDIGLDVDAETIDGLLASISGDDFVTMAVVFNNVKTVTLQLQKLTEQSGEALDFAKRYYGMYVILVKVLDRIQKDFVNEIREQHIPKLRGYARQAEANIDQARKLIAIDGGDRAILEANIESNQVTVKAATYYIHYLEDQARMVEAENRAIERNLATAINSYQTVKVSSDVAALIKAGRRSFEEVMKLRMPYPREFRNEVLRQEFERMTRRLQGGS